MKPVLLLFTLLSWALVGWSQPARTAVEATRFIKLGNTLRMVDRPQQAIDLLLRAVPAVQSKDSYQEAVAYENLGFAYNDLGNGQAAVRYFQKALILYQKLNFAASEAAMRQLIAETSGKDLYAGIDVGSSGLKLAIFRTTFKDGFYAKDIRSKPNAPNVTLVSGTAQSFQAGKDVMKAYLDSIRRYNIPADRVYVAFSSGVNETLGKTPAKKKTLYELLSAQLTGNLPAKTPLSIDTTLTASREAELFMIGSIPRKFWAISSCMDIGSGNTKGGYYDANRRFHSINFPFGTKTLTNLIDKDQSLSIDAYKQKAKQIVAAIADSSIQAEFNSASSGMLQRKTVAFGGGIAWAMTTYLHPEKATTTAVTLTKGDVERFVQLATTDYQSLTHPDLANLTDPILRQKAEADISNVQGQFNEKQLIAGSLLLQAIVNAYTKSKVPKQIVFIRDSDISWVTAKFLETLNQNYERAIAKGAQ